MGPSSAQEREAAILSLLPVVHHVAGRIVARLPRNVTKDDLISAGVVGLIDAVDRFDAGKGCSLKTYATTRIRGAIYDELRAMDWVPRTVHDRYKRLRDAASRISQRYGRDATSEELQAELKMSPARFAKFTRHAEVHHVDSLNAVQADENGHPIELGDIILCANTPTAYEEALRLEDRAIVHAALRRLTRREKLVLCLYYMEDLRFKEIAAIMELTPGRISQIYLGALPKLRDIISCLREQFRPSRSDGAA